MEIRSEGETTKGKKEGRKDGKKEGRRAASSGFLLFLSLPRSISPPTGGLCSWTSVNLLRNTHTHTHTKTTTFELFPEWTSMHSRRD